MLLIICYTAIITETCIDYNREYWKVRVSPDFSELPHNSAVETPEVIIITNISGFHLRFKNLFGLKPLELPCSLSPYLSQSVSFFSLHTHIHNMYIIIFVFTSISPEVQ